MSIRPPFAATGLWASPGTGMIDQRTRQQIDAALGRGDVASAAALAESALAGGQDDPMLLNLAAWRREEARDYDGARALLDRALAKVPDDPTIIAAIGTVLRKQGRYAEALKMLDRATALAPDYMVPWLERGYAFDAAASLHRASESFARAIALDPHSAAALSGYASVAARLGDFAVARAHAERALALDAVDSTALGVIAAADLDAGDSAAAITRLESLLARGDLGEEERIVMLTLLGDALDKQDARTEAFAAWGAAKAGFATLHARHFAVRAETDLQVVERLIAELEATSASDWAAPGIRAVPNEAAQHGFVLGFPRSGNTLAENVLASAPGVATLEEAPTTFDSDEAFLTRAGGLARLASLEAEGTHAFRAAYWSRVSALGLDVAGKAFVDSDPLKSVKLPVMAKLFPNARVMLLLRDPRDIVLSCFRINFAANPATYEYCSLEGIARHYDAVMRLVTLSMERLPVNVQIVRYADLVTDFDTVTKGMCAFLGVPWSASMREFDRTARARNVGTASVAQVRKGLFNGTGQWRRYERQLESVLPILAPWLEKFGMRDG